MFSVRQQVKNGTSKSITRTRTASSRLPVHRNIGFLDLHEGMTGAFDGTLLEESYSSLQDEDDGLIAPDGQITGSA